MTTTQGNGTQVTGTQVTGIFPDRGHASSAVEHLLLAGFAADQLHVVDARATDRHEFIHQRTAGVRRGIAFGVTFGALFGTISGLLLSRLFGVLPAAIVGAGIGGIGGALLGLLIGGVTTTQVEEEIEHQVDAGSVLVSVDTDSAQGQRALDVMARDGAVNMLATATTFSAGVLPIQADGRQQQDISRVS